MIDEFAKGYLHNELRVVREALLWKLDGLSAHADATINALPFDAPGRVPWWPSPDVKLFNIMIHILNEATRHAGHADILREQLDGRTGTAAEYERAIDVAAREAYWAKVEQAARAADPTRHA